MVFLNDRARGVVHTTIPSATGPQASDAKVSRSDGVVDPWIVCDRPQPKGRARLFCFPYAGVGPAVFRAWCAALPADVEVCAVQPPGRGSRLRERAFTRMAPLVDGVADALKPWLDRPYAFFGHSLGGLVAFEVARTLRRMGLPHASHLFISARRAPHLQHPDPPMHGLPDALLVEEVQQRYGGIPQALLQEPELLQMTLPVLRADLEVLETYHIGERDRLDCFISVFGGQDDPSVGVEDLRAWQEYAGGGFSLKVFAGGHFFIQSAQQAFLQALAQDLEAAGTRRAGTEVRA